MCPFHHLLPRTVKLFGFPVYVLFITCSQGLLNYLAFLCMSFWSLAPRVYSIIWLSSLLIMIVPDEDYFLFRYVLLLLVSFHYFSLCFVSFPFRKYISEKNRTRLDTKFTYSQLNTLIYIYSENFTLYHQFSLECVQNEPVILSTIQLQLFFSFCNMLSVVKEVNCYLILNWVKSKNRKLYVSTCIVMCECSIYQL